MEQYGQIISLVVIVGAFYLLLIRPQQKRQKEHQALVTSLEPGDCIVTIGGLHGTIREILDDRLSVEIASGVVVDFSRQAVAQRLRSETPIEQG